MVVLEAISNPRTRILWELNVWTAKASRTVRIFSMCVFPANIGFMGESRVRHKRCWAMCSVLSRLLRRTCKDIQLPIIQVDFTYQSSLTRDYKFIIRSSSSEWRALSYQVSACKWGNTRFWDWPAEVLVNKFSRFPDHQMLPLTWCKNIHPQYPEVPSWLWQKARQLPTENTY